MHEAVLVNAQLSVEKRKAAAGSMQILWERGIGIPQAMQGLRVKT